MGAICQGCGGHVSDNMLRVMYPEGVASDGEVEICPDCPDVASQAFSREVNNHYNGIEYGRNK